MTYNIGDKIVFDDEYVDEYNGRNVYNEFVLTKGKAYTIVDIASPWYRVIMDNGVRNGFLKENFKLAPEPNTIPFPEGTPIRLITSPVQGRRDVGEIFIAADPYTTSAINTPLQCYYDRNGAKTHCPLSYWELAEVVTEKTVTIKQANPGTYGKLVVGNTSGGSIKLELTGDKFFDKKDIESIINSLQKIKETLND